jgi:beta-alanine degradation protein BauB
MIRRLLFVLSFFSLALPVSVFAEEAAATTYPGPQEAAANVYKQLFDNEAVRVSEIKFAPGDKAPMHTHPWPHVVYILDPGQLTITKLDGTSSVVDGKAGDVMYMGAETHEAVNTGTTTLRATITEIK